MKRLLIFSMLLCLGSRSFGQSAALKIVNNTPCTFHGVVNAIDGNLGNGSPCNIAFCFTVTGFSSLTYADPTFANASIYGPFCSVFVPFSGAALAAEFATPPPTPAPNWAWTDIQFSFQCDAPCWGGGTMSEAFPAVCPNNCFTPPSPTTWTNPCSGGTCTWSSPGNCVMNDVVITFN